MTRIVRFEEIDGHIVLRLPDDVAARLNLSAGDEALISDGAKGLTVERLDDPKRRQLEIAMRVIEENDEALAVLAR